MTACTACGHDPLTGRYCSNCGIPAQAGLDRPPTPLDTPPPPRFPLYADEVPTTTATATPPPPPPPLTPMPPAPTSTDLSPMPADLPPVRGGGHAAGRARLTLTPWQVGIAIVLLFALLGGALMVFGGGGGGPETPAAGAATTETEAGPASGGGGAGAASPASVDVLTPSEVTVPGAAEASQDNDGDPVTYDAGNLVDQDPRTA